VWVKFNEKPIDFVEVPEGGHIGHVIDAIFKKYGFRRVGAHAYFKSELLKPSKKVKDIENDDDNPIVIESLEPMGDVNQAPQHQPGMC